MNGAATNNLQATTVPTNAVGNLYQKATWFKRAELMQDILNMVLESESNFTL
jgi:hypothetical protein